MLQIIPHYIRGNLFHEILFPKITPGEMSFDENTGSDKKYPQGLKASGDFYPS